MKLPFTPDLKGKTAVITGGGGVLMGGFARALAACGAKVALLDINAAAADAAARGIQGEGGEAAAFECDCLDRASLERAHGQAEKTFGCAHLLINGAGGNSPRGTTDTEVMERGAAGKTFFDLDPEGLRFVFDINVLSAFLATQVFAKGMAERGGGNIINISSMNAFRPLTKIPAYSAAKAGVSNFTQWLAVHFAPCGIRVNAIAPGFFVTNQNRALLFDGEGRPTARSGKILSHTPLKRFGTEDDLTGTLLWLASDGASGFVTGVVVPVDGGFAAYSGV